MMGAVCAVVYLLIIIVYIPFPFYKDLVAATSGGGNRDVVIEMKEQLETGRSLHRFPHSKVRAAFPWLCVCAFLDRLKPALPPSQWSFCSQCQR